MLRNVFRTALLLGLGTFALAPPTLATPASDAADGWLRYDREQIAASGARSLADFLRQLPLNLQGSLRSARTEIDLGHAGIDLLGAGPERTLVLLDGQPLPDSAVTGRGANIEWLPLAAIERIEILPRSAASRFGGRAAAGVVSLHSRRADGASAGIGLHAPERGGDLQREASARLGGQRGDWRASVGAYVQSLDSLGYPDRSTLSTGGLSTFSNNLLRAVPVSGSPFGFLPSSFISHPEFGSALPGPTACAAPFLRQGPRCFYDFRSVSTLEPALERRQLAASLGWSDGAGAGFHLQALANHSRARAREAADVRTPGHIVQFFIPSGSPNHPAVRFPALGYDPSTPFFVRHRMLGLGPRHLLADQDSYQTTAEWSQPLQTWNLRASLAAGGSDLTQYSPNRIDLDAAQAAVASGEYDLYTPLNQPAELIERIRTRYERHGHSRVQSLEVTVERQAPWSVGGYSITPHASIGLLREDYLDRADPRSVEASASARLANLAEGDRMTRFLQASALASLGNRLDSSTAVRWEKAGGSAWRPNIDLDLAWSVSDTWRASIRAERGYRAARISVDAQRPVSEVTSINAFPFLPPLGDFNPIVENFIVRNPSLRPERHFYGSAELGWQPNERLQLALSLQDWRLRDRHQLIDTTEFAACLAGAGPCPDGVTFVSPGTVLPSPGLGLAGWRVDHVGDLLTNNSMQRAVVNQGGVDRRTASLQGEWLTGEWAFGALSLRGEWVRLLRERLVDARRADHADTYPRQRASLSASWERGAHALTWHTRFFDRTLSFNGQELRGGFGDPDLPSTLASFTQHDLQWRWQLAARSTLRLGVLNLADRKPPIDPLAGSYDPLHADGYLRTAYLRWEQSF
ncbi:TonB-dependent receptor domain-containing protein [Pseudomarimonas salicorniae]|uniref:TonB-dependent receptor n=1 Tax=Pseudomarimonas salicorniae TaxID=2933270 RepID=A0ABT0GFJ5_9GAMM|nr:TonB-dependent receptor [Lysobacter sp. CAU 1642]MCK7593311.1 TonB-dependent receptor [Lysobacter sp. CAU 1642]